jgi:reverse transcriptase-like protein
MRVDTLLMDSWALASDSASLLELEAVVDGLTHGVNFMFNGDRTRLRMQPNHATARKQLDVLRAVIDKAVKAGHSVGPFPEPPWANLQVHPLGLVPKSSGGWRLTEDASFPHGDSVNDHTDVVSQQYERWEQVVDHFARQGRGCLMLQWDKAEAYRSVPLREQDQHLTGFHVPGSGYYFSPNMPFGFSASAYLWKRFMDAFLRPLALKLDIPREEIHSWVDDCLFILTPCASAALATFATLVSTARRYRFMLHPEKLHLSRVVTFLGIVLDSTKMTISIPPAKLDQITARVRDAVSAERWTRRVVQRVVGSLFHVAKCLPHAKAFCGRLLAVLKKRGNATGSFSPPAWAKLDLQAWLSILSSWSGTAIARVRSQPGFVVPHLVFHVDAFGGNLSGAFAGVGLFCLTNGAFASLPFSAHQLAQAHVVATYSTLVLEFAAFPIVLATFASLVHGQVIEVMSDNDGAAATARKGFHSAEVVGGLCRVLTALLVSLDCHVIYSRVDSQDNLADALSRGDPALFRQTASARGYFVAPSATHALSPPIELCKTLQSNFFSEA